MTASAMWCHRIITPTDPQVDLVVVVEPTDVASLVERLPKPESEAPNLARPPSGWLPGQPDWKLHPARCRFALLRPERDLGFGSCRGRVIRGVKDERPCEVEVDGNDNRRRSSRRECCHARRLDRERCTTHRRGLRQEVI